MGLFFITLNSSRHVRWDDALKKFITLLPIHYYRSMLNNILSIYGSTVLLLDLGRFFSFWIPYTVGVSPWMGISPSQSRYLHTEQHKAHRQPCLEWDSNPRSQRSSERRQFMRNTERPRRSALKNVLWSWNYFVNWSNKLENGHVNTDRSWNTYFTNVL
jgi:hypothetical protein